MTNEEMLVDLKQFIEVTVPQQLSQIAIEMATKEDLRAVEMRLDRRIDVLDEKLDQVQDGVAETLTHLAESTDKMLQNHERRITRLERKLACINQFEIEELAVLKPEPCTSLQGQPRFTFIGKN